MWSRLFWQSAAERAIRAFASAVVSLLVVGGAFNAFSFDWLNALGVGLGAAVVSLLLSVGGNAATDGTGPSFNKTEVVRKVP